MIHSQSNKILVAAYRTSITTKITVDPFILIDGINEHDVKKDWVLSNVKKKYAFTRTPENFKMNLLSDRLQTTMKTGKPLKKTIKGINF
ncbi:unnamed protein product [Rhizophagus irregularis]|nr:unnamed protein product [Rhizophagus irregularis]CAB5389020.1 unnamed protein product [Rhizophagus irregularis]